jgi:predicted outer membrane protein
MTHLEEKLKKQLREAKGELSMRRPLDTMDEIAYKELEKENGDLRTSIGRRIDRELYLQNQIEILKKEIDLLRDQAQIDKLESDKVYSTNTTLLQNIKTLQDVEKEHKKYVGNLLKELDSKDEKIQALLSKDQLKLRKLGIF